MDGGAVSGLVEVALAVVCAALVVLPGIIVGQRQLDHRRHAKALANIARLERELGFDVPLEQRIDRALQVFAPQRPSWIDYAEQHAGRPLDRAPEPYKRPSRFRKGSLRTKWGERWP